MSAIRRDLLSHVSELVSEVHPLKVDSDTYNSISHQVEKFVAGDVGLYPLDVEIPLDEDPAAYWPRQFVYPTDSEKSMTVVLRVGDVVFDYDESQMDIEGISVRIYPFVSKAKAEDARRNYGDDKVNPILDKLRSSRAERN